jgi:hypothetical protein
MSNDDIKHESIPLHEGKPVSTEFRTKIDTDPYLVIEVVKESFYKQQPSKLEVGYDDKNNISTKKIISPNRWNHIKFFIFIQPSAEQLYVASNLRMPHYQMEQKELENFKSIAVKQCGFIDRETDGDFRILSNDKNHHRRKEQSYNDLGVRDTLRYVTVLNKFTGNVDDGVIRLYKFLSEIPTDIIADLVHARRLLKDHRGNIYFDWGESGSRNCGRLPHYGSGCSFPRGRSIVPALSLVEEELILDALEKLSMIFTDDQLQHFIPGDVAAGEECFSHPKGVRESFRKVLKLDEKFGQKYSGIVYPRARFHYTGSNNLVLPHCDWENALHALSAFVASFCRYVQYQSPDGTPTIRRTGFHGYGCQALENCQQRYNKIQPFVKEVSEFYTNDNIFGHDRKVVDERLFTQRIDEQWYRFEPHASKIVGLSCFADSIIRFSHRCKSKISIRNYIGLCFNTIACESPDYFIDYLDNIAPCDDDRMLAWSMYQHIVDPTKRQHYNNNNVMKDHQMHQPTHRLIEKEPYDYNIDVLLLVVQYYLFQEVKDEYQNHSLALSVMVQNVTGCGELLSHHVLFVMSLIGLVPDCVCSYAEFASTTRTSQHLHEQFVLFPDDEEYVECSYHALKALAVHLGVSMMEAENVTCKWVQYVKGSHGRWRYSISPKQQFVFHYDASLGKIVMYSKEGMVNRIQINFDINSVGSSNDLKKLRGSKKCLKKKQAWKGKKRPPTCNVIKVAIEERQATKFDQVLRVSGIGDGQTVNSMAIQRINEDFSWINMNQVIGYSILLCDKPISDRNDYVFEQLHQSGTFVSSEFIKRYGYANWWTVSLKHVPFLVANNEETTYIPWSIRDSFNPDEIESKLLFPAGSISKTDYYEHDGMFYFNIKAKAINFINLCAFLYLDQERTYGYLLKRFMKKKKHKETKHTDDLSFNAGCYMFLKLENNALLKNYYEGKKKQLLMKKQKCNNNFNNGIINNNPQQQNKQDVLFRDEIFDSITGARPPLLVVYDNIGTGRKLRGFHVYLLRYTDFAYDRVQVSMEKATFITSDYSMELPAPDYSLELPDPNVKSTFNTNTAAAVPYPDVRIRLNTNTTAEETKEECDDPFGLDNVAPPLEYEQYEQSKRKRKRISCMDVAYI